MRRLAFVAMMLLGSALPLTAAMAATPAYEQPLSARAVQDVQARLRALGYYAGPVDGVWGEGTRGALERFQGSRHLAVTGELNQATVTAMGLDPDRLLSRGYEPRPAYSGERAVAPVGTHTTHAVQVELRRRGFYRGPIDGVWGRRTELAFQDFERSRNLAVTTTPTRESILALGLRPEDFMSGSSYRETPADRLNREELERR